MAAIDEPELERLLDLVRELLGAADDSVLADANRTVNDALHLQPESVEAWLLKCQIASALGDDHAALAAVEMALKRSPQRTEALYWRGAILGDLGRAREALHAIEAALRLIGDDAHWLLEDLYFEKVTLLDALGLAAAALATREAALARCPGSSLIRDALAETARARLRSSLRVLRGGIE